ncbi:hypothetical protein JR316_0008414 [Psilocybe cubensis]|uniref:Uncharacterized protein n=1 Tax=Psilocybe cubensis TaxID=181762 RepID=A0ACB8GWG7_PSICU|nr:hypothetical protein JR316_0008414 [Psilocybe cubensis]KAH9479819.1 hypothetical protein JR316_0008414 [Psilocybe cubensis]
MAQLIGEGYVENWKSNNAVPRERELTTHNDKPTSQLVTPDGFIDTNGRIELPSSSVLQSQSHSNSSIYPPVPDEVIGSPSSAKSFSSTAPKLQIITDLRSVPNSLNSQTPTPYSDTLLSVQDSMASPPNQKNSDEPLLGSLRRSISEPPKRDRPRSAGSPRSQEDYPTIPQLIEPQPSITPARTPITPMLARSSSRRKADVFVAHNPFIGHRHGTKQTGKQELTFDDIPTPGPFSHSFGTSVEDPRGVTPVEPHNFEYQTPISRSHSRRIFRPNDINHNTPSKVQVSASEPVEFNVVRSQSYSAKTNRVRRNHIHPDEEAISSSIQRPTQVGISRNSGSGAPDALLSLPTVIDKNSSYRGKSDDQIVPSEKTSEIETSASIIRTESRDSSKDDPEKGSIETDEHSSPQTLWSRFRVTLGNILRRPAPVVSEETEFQKSLTATTASFIATTLPKQVYLHLLLRLPLLYFSRVSRIFEEADMTLPEIKRMALETPVAASKWRAIDLSIYDRAFDVPLEYQRLSSTWEFFIDSVLREWKIFNIISGLLLSAILTILQIDTAAQNPVTRYTALFSLICSLISLLFGCMYIIRFGTMRKPYKAAEWALEARNESMIWWNVWVLLAMPAIWLTWSIVLYIACIMAFAWQTTSQDDTPPSPLSPTTVLVVRVLLTSVLVSGVIYGILIVSTFSRYGEAMDKAWKERIDTWAEEMDVATSADGSSEHLWREPYTPSADITPSRQGPVSPGLPLRSPRLHAHLVHDGNPAGTPDYDTTIANNPGSILGNRVASLREKRRVRFRSPKESPVKNTTTPMFSSTLNGSVSAGEAAIDSPEEKS